MGRVHRRNTGAVGVCFGDGSLETGRERLQEIIE